MNTPFATFFKEYRMNDQKENDGQHLGAGRGDQQQDPATKQTGKEGAPGQSNPHKEGAQDGGAPVDPAPVTPALPNEPAGGTTPTP